MNTVASAAHDIQRSLPFIVHVVVARFVSSIALASFHDDIAVVSGFSAPKSVRGITTTLVPEVESIGSDIKGV